MTFFKIALNIAPFQDNGLILSGIVSRNIRGHAADEAEREAAEQWRAHQNHSAVC